MDDEEESLIKKDIIATKDQPKDEAGLFLAISFSRIAQKTKFCEMGELSDFANCAIMHVRYFIGG